MKEHNCDKMPKDWIIETERDWYGEDYWRAYSYYNPQETGMSDFYYCPWCGKELNNS